MVIRRFSRIFGASIIGALFLLTPAVARAYYTIDDVIALLCNIPGVQMLGVSCPAVTAATPVATSGSSASGPVTIPLGSSSCGGGWCYPNAQTATHICNVNGYDTLTDTTGGGAGGNVCGWTGSGYACDSSCTSSCSGITLTQVSCVNSAPPVRPTCTLTASPASVSPGGSTTLMWTSANAVSISISPSIGSVTPVASGSRLISPGVTTAYTATVIGPSTPKTGTFSLGATDCGGGWCGWDMPTKQHLCQLNGYGSVVSVVQGGGGGNVCGQWDGSWHCDSRCTTSCGGRTLTQIVCENPLDGSSIAGETGQCSTTVTITSGSQCSDGIDNDGDGWTDHPNDLGCSGPSDDDETNAPLPQCSDRVDNDGDDTADYGGAPGYVADPGCSSVSDDDETDPALPDLTAHSVKPTTAVVNTPLVLSAIVTNIGNAATGAGFKDLFEINPNSIPVDFASIQTLRTYASAALAAGADSLASISYTFPSAGMWYARVCADLGTDNTGVIDESNENNNCGGWTAITVSAAHQCSDGIDNDHDGKKDYPQDSGCSSPGDDDESDAPQCSDGVNNDGDAWTDFPQDPGCSSAGDDTEHPNPQCSDGIDNDHDGRTDSADPACHSDGNPGNPGSYTPGGGSEGGGGGTQCSDGIDNDGDGSVDYPNDAGCSSSADDSEAPPQCSDGADNDGDGKADFPDDLGCSSANDTEEASPAGAVDLSLYPDKTIRYDSAATLKWTAESVQNGSCRVTAMNYNSGALSGTGGTLTTPKLKSQTTFTLHCRDLEGNPVSDTVIVRVTPKSGEF